MKQSVLILLASIVSLHGCVAGSDDLNAGLGAAFGDDGQLALVGVGTFDEIQGLWVSQVDREGRPAWQTMFGTGDDEEITDFHVERGGEVVVAGSVLDADACPDSGKLRGFVAEIGPGGDVQRTRLARRTPGGECEERNLAIREVARTGDRRVALGVENGWKQRSSTGVTVFTFDDDGVHTALEYDGELFGQALLGHREGFVVAGQRRGERGEEPGVSVTAFSPEGEVLWHRGVEAATDESASLVASNIVDGEVVVVLQRLSGEEEPANIFRYDLTDGQLLWSSAVAGDGVPFAVVDGPRKRWALVRADVWDFEIVTWRRDTPQAAIAYTAEGITHLAFRFRSETEGEIVDRGAANVVRWWDPTDGADCDRPAGLIATPSTSPSTLALEESDHAWMPTNVELLPWDVETGARSGKLPLDRCIDDQSSP